MKSDEIRGKKEDELDYELANMKKELFDLRFKSNVQAIQNPARIRALRRTIARVNTIRNERARAARGDGRKSVQEKK